MPAALPSGTPAMDDLEPPQRDGRLVGRYRSISIWSASLFIAAVGVGLMIWLLPSDDRSSQTGNDVPIVRASDMPVKIRPEEPGGMHVAHRDKLIYQRFKDDEAPPVVEKLMSAPEEPLPPPGSEPSSSEDSVALDADGDMPSTEFLSALPENSASVEPMEEFFDGTPPEAPLTVEPSSDSSSVAMVAPRPRPTAPPSAPSTSRAESGLSAEARVAQSLLMGSTAGEYAIQLASVRSRQEADREWKRLRRSHADILSSLQLTVLEADLGQRGKYYRLRAGPITNEDSARQTCKFLVDRKVTCIVVPY